MLFQSIEAQWAQLVGVARSASPNTTAGIVVVLTLIITTLARKQHKNISNVPVHGYTSILEPTILLQSRFVTGAKGIVASGYQKVR